LDRITQISGGVSHSLFLSSNQVYSCGANYWGQLGLNTTTIRYNSPQLIPSLNGIIQISAGYFHSLFLSSSNQVYSCGYNREGQLGLNSNTILYTSPQLIRSQQRFTSISGGGGHSLAIAPN